jgi:putative FmdB family regulatory protein
MPIYEYRCEGCGKVFGKIERFSDPPLTMHEECGGKVERLISAPSFQFKGTGFYITDYAKGSNSAKENGGKGETKSSESKDSKESKESKESKDSKESKASKESKDSKPAETKGESKPAAPAASKSDS